MPWLANICPMFPYILRSPELQVPPWMKKTTGKSFNPLGV